MLYRGTMEQSKEKTSIATILKNAENIPVDADLKNIGVLLLSDPTHNGRKIVYDRNSKTFVRTPGYTVDRIQRAKSENPYSFFVDTYKHALDIALIAKNFGVLFAADYERRVLLKDAKEAALEIKYAFN